MIGIDTNVLVRYLTQDDKLQADIVNKFFDQIIQDNQSIFINNIVICELIWVLEAGYKYPRTEIVNVLTMLFTVEQFHFENLEILWLALETYQITKQTDYSDILISFLNQKYFKVSETVTFDKKAINIEGFTMLTS